MRDLDAILVAHARAVEGFAGMLRGVSPDTAIPGLTWTAGELGAHVLAGARDYERAAVAGVDVWTDLRDGDAQNAGQLARTTERDTAVIADRLLPAMRALHDAWRGARGPVRWSAGLVLPVEVVAGVQLADVLVHSHDLGRAAKGRLQIDRGDAILAIGAVAAIAPHFVAPAAQGFVGAFEIRLRGDDRLIFAFDDGTLRVDPPQPPRIDCRLSADPASFLLASYGRIPVWRLALTGGVVATGRKPWLGLRFKSLLRNP